MARNAILSLFLLAALDSERQGMRASESLYPTPVPIADGETVNIKSAARIANVSPDTVGRWCRVFGIGRQPSPGSIWRVSLPALRMVVACDDTALEAFRAGDRRSELVARYLEQEAA